MKKILIITALDIERKPIEKMLSLKRDKQGYPRISRGVFLDFEIFLINTGIGRRLVKKSLGKFLESKKFDAAIVTGLAGAISGDLKVADIVIPEKLEKTGEGIKSVSQAFFSRIKSAAHQADLNVKIGSTLYTSDAILNKEAKASFRMNKPDVLAVDMESYYCAGLLEQAQIPFVVIRGVSERSDFEFPDVILIGASILKILRLMVVKPGQFVRVMQLWMNSISASKNAALTIRLLLEKSTLPK